MEKNCAETYACISTTVLEKVEGFVKLAGGRCFRRLDMKYSYDATHRCVWSLSGATELSIIFGSRKDLYNHAMSVATPLFDILNLHVSKTQTRCLRSL